MRRNRSRFIKFVLAVALVCLPVVQTIQAQDKESTGHIKGIVADRTGVVVANNKITFENATSKFEATSDDKGLFELKLPAGTYQVTTEKVDGFEPIKLSKVRIRSDKTTMLHLQVLAAGQDASCEVKPAPVKKKSAEKQSKP